MAKQQIDCVWSDRKRTIFGLPWSFTKYYLTDNKFLIVKGLLRQTEEEVRLYRIMDMTLTRSFGERLNKVGTIHVCSADKTAAEFDIRHIKNPRKVKELLSEMVEKQRVERGVTMREEMFHDMRDGDHDGVPD